MNFLLSIQVGLREILAHKFRSFLTMFGIILGVASLVSMFATLEGMTRGMKENLSAEGGVERITVIDQEVPLSQLDIKDLSPGRTLADVEAIRRECPLIVDISPEVAQHSTLQLLNKTTRNNVNGVTPSILNVMNHNVEFGRFLSDLDLQTCANVCVIGWPIWDQLEQSRLEDPVGKTLKINDVPFRIVGVLRDFESEYDQKMRLSGKQAEWEKRAKERRNQAKGKQQRRNLGWWKSNVVFIPISTMQGIFKSASLDLGFDLKGPERRLSYLNLKVVSPDVLGEAIDQIRASLLRTHRGVEDFGFDTRENWADAIETSVQASRLTGGIISGISLLVGGIGIANIMLASISERVREIGIRMAVGARKKDIFIQILIESSVLGMIGGIIGLAASFGVIELILRVAKPNNAPVVVTASLFISFGFSVLTGVLAGIYPAFTAARLDPIQALRYE